LEQVDNFIYLGSTKFSDGGSQADTKQRIVIASCHVVFATNVKKKKISHKPRRSVAWELIPFEAL